MASRAHGFTAEPAYQVVIDVGGHPLLADEPLTLGGQDAGPSPFGLVLAGLVACTATTLRMYAERKDWAGVRIDVHLDLDTTGPKPLIHRKVEVTGAPNEAAMERLRDIVERTPVTLALKSGFEIETKLSGAS